MNFRPRRYAVLNRKGGVGKSTVAVNTAHGLARRGYRVLLTDTDGQNDAALFLGFLADDFEHTLADVPEGNASLEDCVVRDARPGLDLLPSGRTAALEARLWAEPDPAAYWERLLGGLFARYDFVVTDCGPARSKINDAVLCRADGILVPVQAESAAVRAVGNVYEYLAELGLSAEKIALVVPTMFDPRTKDAKENLAFLREFFAGGAPVSSPIPRRVKIAEGGKYGKTVYESDRNAAAGFDEIVERLVKDRGLEP